MRKIQHVKTEIVFVRINNYWFRYPQGIFAIILQWFALDLEPPSWGRVRCNTTAGEKLFYNL
ncbi:MAG: hypothetical protein NG784_15640 [Candidatus Jettenia sp.]|nr:hypothetical protein [Candidatus Jettenia sp.]UJS16512.1 MAG: hypothetical protein L3J17_11375 [Candidatus Jettenia sp.]